MADDEWLDAGREDYLAEAKRRALQWLDAGDVRSAIASMMGDLDKRQDTKMNAALVAFGMLIATREDAIEARRWIEGWR